MQGFVENIDDLPKSVKGIPLEFLDAVKRQVGDELWKAKEMQQAPEQITEERKTLAMD